MANMIARLGVALGIDTAEFNRGIEQAGKKLEQFSEAAEKFGKMGAVALVAASAAALKYADELADVAEANEVAIGTVLQLSNALANSGGKADNAGKMLTAFAKFIDDAAGGSLEAQKTAKALGVTLQDLGKLSQEELLNKLVKNLAEIEDPITRNAKAMEIFSKAAKGVDMVGFAEQMAKANPLIQEQEKAIKDAAETYDLLAQTSRNVMTTLAVELGPILKATIDYIKDLAGETNLLGPIFKTVFQTIAITVADVAFVIGGLLRQLQLTATIFKSVIPSYDDKEFENIFGKKEIADIIARQDLDRFINKVMGVSEYGNSIDALAKKGGATTGSGGGRKVTPARDKDAEAAEKARLKALEHQFKQAQIIAKIQEEMDKKQVEAYANFSKKVTQEEKQLEIAKELFAIEESMKDQRSEDIKLTKDLYLAEQKRLENIREINLNTELDGLQKLDLIDRENALANATERYLRAQNQAVKAQREGSFGEGFMKEAGRFFRDMPTELENGAKAFGSVMGNMESALDNFVRTGKLSFKSLARSIIQDLIAIQLKASSNAIFRTLLSSFGFMNDKGGMEVSGSLGFADGGNPPVGKASIVGERGPELFVPRTAGTIIPNHALGGMGGTTMVTNNYINAIDTKSFEERLYGSSNAIWAANQYANKSLAVNRGRA
jgi:lambda family phage tail tape measure protein